MKYDVEVYGEGFYGTITITADDAEAAIEAVRGLDFYGYADDAKRKARIRSVEYDDEDA